MNDIINSNKKTKSLTSPRHQKELHSTYSKLTKRKPILNYMSEEYSSWMTAMN